MINYVANFAGINLLVIINFLVYFVDSKNKAGTNRKKFTHIIMQKNALNFISTTVYCNHNCSFPLSKTKPNKEKSGFKEAFLDLS